MKKVFAILLVLAMVFGLAACGGNTNNNSNTGTSTGTNTEANANTGSEKTDDKADDTSSKTVYKVGMVCIGNNEAAYDRNFYMAADAAKERLAAKGIDIEWIYTYNHPEGDPVAVDCEELADEGCVAVFCNSYGQEPAMLTVAGDYPDTFFAGLTNENSYKDKLPNTINAFPSIYEGRYLAGVAAGLKLQQMIDEGQISEDEAIIGYVGAYTFAEVISGYTSYFLGARSVCPSVTMAVEFIGSWGDPKAEADAAKDLIETHKAVMVSQHSDSTTPSTTAQDLGVYHTGYNISMSDVAPAASIISTRIDWTNYFEYVIETAVKGGEVEQDYKQHGLKDGDVVMTELNTAIAAPGTAEKLEEVRKQIESGAIQVFDTDTFTVGGEKVTSAFAIDTDGDFAADSEEAVFDGAFHESYHQSAPYFALRIDGIKLVNEAY